MKKWFLLVCLAGWLQGYHLVTSLALGAPSIQPLGAPVGFNDFTPTDVNGNGSVIVGTSLIPGDPFSFAARGFRWTAAGFQDLGSLGGNSVRPMRTSGQGDVVVGHANLVSNSVEFRIFRWTTATGIQNLEQTFAAAPTSISTDGTTISASLWSSGPVRWTAVQGFTPISVPPFANPYDISGDGSVVVANDLGLVYTAYRWTATGGAVALPGLGGCSNDRVANSISSSGTFTVGYSSYRSQPPRPGECPPMAVRWNGTAIQELRFLPNGSRSVAKDVSADGSVVVGYSTTTGNVQVGFIWQSTTNTMQDLNQILVGVPGAANYLVTDAIAVSGDGNVVAAIALNKNTGTFETLRIVLSGASPSPTPTASPTPGLPAPSLISPPADARFAPGTNITFDWSDVAGATSYTIQIDDRNTFTLPLILDQTVATSQFSTSTLPTLRMWWRVRANNGGGSGPWSAVRRFEVKN